MLSIKIWMIKYLNIKIIEGLTVIVYQFFIPIWENIRYGSYGEFYD